MGVHLTPGATGQAAEQLAGDSRFREIQVPRDQLSELPPGAVVCWPPQPHKGQDHPGHVSISLGHGQEASDHVQDQIESYKGHRVFLMCSEGEKR
jgi:hypothetical protein